MYVKFEIRLKRRNQIEYLRDERWNRTQMKTLWHYWNSSVFAQFYGFQGLWRSSFKNFKAITYRIVCRAVVRMGATGTIHSVTDYKKHLYMKRLVDLVLTKKQTLVYFSDLRNAFCRKLFFLKQLRNAQSKIALFQSQKLMFCFIKCLDSTIFDRYALRLNLKS